MRRLAAYLRVHPTLISQVLNTEKDLSLEQGILICEYLGMSEAEREYFIALMEYERAGSKALKNYFLKRLQFLKKQADLAVTKSGKAEEIREQDKAIFYSQWYHSAVRLLTSLSECKTLDTIAEKLKLPKSQVRKTLDFLASVGLVKESNGKYEMGPSRTWVPANSPYAARHHINWRLKAFETYQQMGEADLALTVPMTLSKQDAVRFRKLLVEFIESLNPLIDASEPEELRCLNVDFFSPLPAT